MIDHLSKSSHVKVQPQFRLKLFEFHIVEASVVDWLLALTPNHSAPLCRFWFSVWPSWDFHLVMSPDWLAEGLSFYPNAWLSIYRQTLEQYCCIVGICDFFCNFSNSAALVQVCHCNLKSENQIRFFKFTSIDSTRLISSPNPMIDYLLESSRWDDSNKWSNIGFGGEIGIIEKRMCTLSGAWYVL